MDEKINTVDAKGAGAGERPAATTIKFLSALGCKRSTSKTIEHVNDDSIVYLVGRHVAIHNYVNPAHRFILKNSKTSEIVAFAVSANRRYIALSESLASGQIQVSVYNFNTASRVRTVPYEQTSKLQVVGMNFSRDNKYLVSITKLPDVMIHLWQLDTATLLATEHLTDNITQITISPWAHWTFCTTGHSCCKVWRYVEKRLTHVDIGSTRPGYHFTCHTWYDDDRIVVGTEEGDILVVENNQIVQVLPHVLRRPNELDSSQTKSRAVYCITAVGRGILCGGDDGFIALYERTFDPTTHFLLFKCLRTTQRSVIVDVTISPNEENVVMAFENNAFATIRLEEMYSLEDAPEDEALLAGGVGGMSSPNFSLNNTAMDPDSTTMLDTTSGTLAMTQAVPASYHDDQDGKLEREPNNVSLLPIGFHSDTVTAADVCIQRSIVVTSSIDNTVRIWNFVKRRVEVTKQLEDEVLSVALHPMGIRIVVGMRNCVRMYSVLAGTLHACWETPTKPCFEVRFSHGGQYFGTITNKLTVYNSYDFTVLGTNSGHTTAAKTMCWRAYDEEFLTAESTGSIMSWLVSDFKKSEVDDARKNASYSCVRVDDEIKGVAALGIARNGDYGYQEGEMLLRCLVADQESRTARVGMFPKSTRRHLTDRSKEAQRSHTTEIAISPCAQTLFVGTPAGQIMLYKWPLPEVPEPYQKYEVHNGEVLFVVLSVDERYLFTIGEDNCMFMFDIDAVVEGKGGVRKSFNYTRFDEISYVLQNNMENVQEAIFTCQKELEDTERARKADVVRVESECEKERVTMERQLMESRDNLKVQLQASKREVQELQHALIENTKRMDAVHTKAAGELERIYTKKADEAAERLRHLQEERDMMLMRFDNKIYKMRKEHEIERKALEEKLRVLEAKRVKDVEKLRREQEEDLNQMEEMLQQTIGEYEGMLDEVRRSHKQQVTAVEEKISAATNSATSFKRKQEKLDKEKDAIFGKLKENDHLKAERDKELARRKQENDEMKSEMVQRNDAILQSEKKISNLKQQTAELEKLRYVLTYKFNELKKEVAPKDKIISDLNDTVVQLDNSLEKAGVERDTLRSHLMETDKRLKSVVSSVAKQRTAIEDKERMISNLLRDLTNIVADNLPPDEARAKVGSVVERYNVKFSNDMPEVARDKVKEYRRQATYMESQVHVVRRENITVEDHLREENRQKITENATLVKEINDLRAAKKQLATKTSLAETQLNEARATLQRLTSVLPDELRTGAAGGRASASPSPIRAASSSGPSPSPHLGSRPKGKIIKGCTRTLRDLTHLDTSKIAEVVAQVERNEAEMHSQRTEIRKLQEFVQHLLDRATSDATGNGDAPTSAPSAQMMLHLAQIRQHLSGATQAMTPAPAPSAPM